MDKARQLKRSKIRRSNEKTPSVKDLICFLKQFPEDLPVVGCWEGQNVNIYGGVIHNKEKHNDISCNVLGLIVESDGYDVEDFIYIPD